MFDKTRPIFWHQGLFLQPHHFQQLELNINNLLASQLSHIRPYFWGITELEIDQGAIKEGFFRINKFSALFQDGSWIDFPGNAVVVARSFEEILKDESRQFLKIYAGIMRWSPSLPNVKETEGEITKNEGVRFVSPIEPEEVKDIYLGKTLAQIRFMNYVVHIFWETEIEDLGNYCLIPVALLERDGSNMVISEKFIPPVLSLKSSNYLKQIISNIKNSILSRLQILEGYKLSKDITYTDLQGSSLRYVLALIVLNRYLPLLDHLLSVGVVHPWEIYGLLRGLVGELSSFTERINAMGRTYNGIDLVPEYEHANINNCFSEILILIEELLGSIIIGAENIIKLEKTDDGFCGKIPLSSLDTSNTFSLVVNTKADKDEIIDSFKHVVKVAPKHVIGTLISRALPGFSLIHRQTPPAGIPKDQNSLFFEINTSDKLWGDLMRDGNICVYWDDAPEDVKIMLVISKF
ncbi:type VI secretion system baseplate subunit TssK [Deferribacter abyssi]|uniref:type VI secretion system baseplate subunit TssK n=1 Tax=Deferribacter abyssi TaxID=213806 RepID=UPI003C24B9F8